MCDRCEAARQVLPTRRTFAAGLAAAIGLAPLRLAAETAGPACFSPAVLAGQAAEKLPRRPTAADAFVMPAPAAALPPVPPHLAGVIRRVDLAEGERLVALTFDLCQTRSPIAGYDGALVDYLRRENVPATFFPAGRWLLTHRARAVQLAADPRFVLANHSFDHPDLHFAATDRIRNEILLTEAALADIRAEASRACAPAVVPAPPLRLFRFPYGSCAPGGIAAANAVGSVIIQWDTVSGDPDGTSSAAIVRNVMGSVRPGSISVMHANGRGTHTAEALAVLVPKLRAAGYRFVTVPELIAAGRPSAATACYITRPGDTARYDTPAKSASGKSAPPAKPRGVAPEPVPRSD